MTERFHSDQMVIDYKKYQSAVRKRAFSEVLELMDKHIKEAQEQDEDISMMCAVMADVEALKGGEQE